MYDPNRPQTAPTGVMQTMAAPAAATSAPAAPRASLGFPSGTQPKVHPQNPLAQLYSFRTGLGASGGGQQGSVAPAPAAATSAPAPAGAPATTSYAPVENHPADVITTGGTAMPTGAPATNPGAPVNSATGQPNGSMLDMIRQYLGANGGNLQGLFGDRLFGGGHRSFDRDGFMSALQTWRAGGRIGPHPRMRDFRGNNNMPATNGPGAAAQGNTGIVPTAQGGSPVPAVDPSTLPPSQVAQVLPPQILQLLGGNGG